MYNPYEPTKQTHQPINPSTHQPLSRLASVTNFSSIASFNAIVEKIVSILANYYPNVSFCIKILIPHILVHELLIFRSL